MQIYGPRFKRQADTFQNLFDAAKKESEELKKYFRYQAEDYSQLSTLQKN